MHFLAQELLTSNGYLRCLADQLKLEIGAKSDLIKHQREQYENLQERLDRIVNIIKRKETWNRLPLRDWREFNKLGVRGVVAAAPARAARAARAAAPPAGPHLALEDAEPEPEEVD